MCNPPTNTQHTTHTHTQKRTEQPRVDEEAGREHPALPLGVEDRLVPALERADAEQDRAREEVGCCCDCVVCRVACVVVLCFGSCVFVLEVVF